MNKRGILKYKQTKKYVLYYIFYNEEPIYVGVSNNFKSRRGQHFNERYRDKDPYKKLYQHMKKNNIYDYEMLIVAQANRAKSIDDLERAHIEKVRSVGLAWTNVSDGGGYARTDKNMPKEILLGMYKELNEIRDECFDYEYIDLASLEKRVEEVDWGSLYNICDCWEHDILYDYEYFLSSNKLDEDDLSIDMYIMEEVAHDEISPQSLVSTIMHGERSIPKYTKERAIDNYISTIRYIENMNSSLSKYIGLRLLFGADYENDILQEVEEHDYEVYSLLDCFLPSSEKEGLFVWKICILRKEKDMIMI